MLDDEETKLFAVGLVLLILVFLTAITVVIAIGYFFGKGFCLIAMIVLLLLMIAVVVRYAKKVLNDKDKM